MTKSELDLGYNKIKARGDTNATASIVYCRPSTPIPQKYYLADNICFSTTIKQ